VAHGAVVGPSHTTDPQCGGGASRREERRDSPASGCVGHAGVAAGRAAEQATAGTIGDASKLQGGFLGLRPAARYDDHAALEPTVHREPRAAASMHAGQGIYSPRATRRSVTPDLRRRMWPPRPPAPPAVTFKAPLPVGKVPRAEFYFE
jgi:hypothetical protein